MLPRCSLNQGAVNSATVTNESLRDDDGKGSLSYWLSDIFDVTFRV